MKATLLTAFNCLALVFLIAVFVEFGFKIVGRLMRLHLIGVELYLSGRWTCDALPQDQQAALWARFRDALGLPEGSATALGVGDTGTTTYNEFSNDPGRPE